MSCVSKYLQVFVLSLLRNRLEYSEMHVIAFF